MKIEERSHCPEKAIALGILGAIADLFVGMITLK
jgi:hypothetical protein